MRILVLGKRDAIPIVYQTIRNCDWIVQTILWEDEQGPEQLTEIQLDGLDYIVTVFMERRVGGNITQLLKRIFQITEDKIIDFYQFYEASIPMMTVERIMDKPFINEYEGLIVGISHAEVGIIPRRLDKKFANLAVSSQDIYYNLKTLEYCKEKYWNKVQNIQYLVIEMFDYTYFNFDISRTKQAISYYENGGYNLDGHNFSLNSNYEYSFEQVMAWIYKRRYGKMTDVQINAWSQLFGDAHGTMNYSEYVTYKNISDRVGMVKSEDVTEYVVETGMVKNVHEDTIRDNIQYFYEMLKLAYEWNSDMKVFVLLMPRYYEVQKKVDEACVEWKERFYYILEEARKDYKFEILDLCNHEISKESAYYQDVSHFNYYGAVKFTDLLNEYLFAEKYK